MVKVLAMGRRWGKTVLALCVCGACSSAGGRVAWIVPTYKNSRPIWRQARNSVAALVKAGVVKVSESERIIEFVNGGSLAIYSVESDKGDSLRGEAFDLVVFDEAAKCPEEAWYDAALPTLADRNGKAILISTPRGRNWFHAEYAAGLACQDGRQRSWRAPTTDNPSPAIRSAAVAAEDRLPSRSFKQEWLAEFVSGGAVFPGLDACIRPAAADDARAMMAEAMADSDLPARERDRMCAVSVGVDLGKQRDATVFCALHHETRAVVGLQRMVQVPYTIQAERLKQFMAAVGAQNALVEVTGVGSAVAETLSAAGIPFQPFQTTNETKAEIIGNLIKAFEDMAIAIPSDPVLVGELEAFEVKYTITGRPVYSAPNGDRWHDDCVMALALALEAVGRSSMRMFWL